MLTIPGTAIAGGAGLAGTTAAGILATAAATTVTAGAAGAVVLTGLIINAIGGDSFSKASKTLNIAEDRLAKTRQAYNELELCLKQSEGELKLLDNAEKKLVSLDPRLACFSLKF
jgi:hypothetical protein